MKLKTVKMHCHVNIKGIILENAYQYSDKLLLHVNCVMRAYIQDLKTEQA